jgi:hypothetical protein
MLAGVQNFKKVPCDNRHHHAGLGNMEANARIQFEDQGDAMGAGLFRNLLWTLEVANGGVRAHWPHRDKKFRLQRHATLTVTTPSPLPSPWRQTVSSCSLATATLSLLSWLLTGMSCLFCTAQGAPWHVDLAPSWLQRSSTTRLDCCSDGTDVSLALTVLIGIQGLA